MRWFGRRARVEELVRAAHRHAKPGRRAHDPVDRLRGHDHGFRVRVLEGTLELGPGRGDGEGHRDAAGSPYAQHQSYPRETRWNEDRDPRFRQVRAGPEQCPRRHIRRRQQGRIGEGALWGAQGDNVRVRPLQGPLDQGLIGVRVRDVESSGRGEGASREPQMVTARRAAMSSARCGGGTVPTCVPCGS